MVVVVSAMGRRPAPYATDTLLGLLRQQPSPRAKDLAMSCGEILSAAVMSDLLEFRGIGSEPLVLDQIGILTDETHGDAEILEINPQPILAAFKRESVVVIPGFQGASKHGHVTTLGRGGSDTTAAAVGAALKAELVEIYTDVDGVMSADPRLVPEAFTIREITFEEVGEMAHLGAKVVHPKAVTFAMEAKLPLRVRSTFSKNSGTLISDQSVKFKNWITGVTHIPDMAYVSIDLEEEKDVHLARTKIFSEFAKSGISLDLITVARGTISFIIHEAQSDLAKDLLLRFSWKFRVETGFAKVSVVGAGMRGRPGIMSRVVETLYNAGIALHHSTDSHITIACLVKQSDMKNAVQALHAAFITS